MVIEMESALDTVLGPALDCALDASMETALDLVSEFALDPVLVQMSEMRSVLVSDQT